MTKSRTFFAKCAFGERKQFYFGTATADSEEHARRLLSDMMAETFPDLPDILAVMPGQIIVQYD